MYHVANKEKDPHDFVIPYAQFHLGKAHFQGYGVDESEEEAERYSSYRLLESNEIIVIFY